MNKDISQTNIFTVTDLLDEWKNRTFENIAVVKSRIIADLIKEIDQQKQLIKAAYTALSIYQKILKEISTSDKETT